MIDAGFTSDWMKSGASFFKPIMWRIIMQIQLLLDIQVKKINSQTFRLDLSARDIFPQIT